MLATRSSSTRSSRRAMAMRSLTATAAISFLAALAAPACAGTIDDARMKAAGADTANWLLHGRDYGNQRFSPLEQINTSNAGKLVPKFIYQTGISGTFSATPLVADGVMYISTPFSNVVAIDAATGKEKWRYEHKRTTEKLCCGPANRGVSLGYGKVYIGTVDAHLIALDQETGKKVWDITLVEAPVTTEDKKALQINDPRAKDSVSGSTGVG